MSFSVIPLYKSHMRSEKPLFQIGAGDVFSLVELTLLNTVRDSIVLERNSLVGSRGYLIMVGSFRSQK